MLWGQMSTWGPPGSLGSKPSCSRQQCLVLSSSFLNTLPARLGAGYCIIIETFFFCSGVKGLLILSDSDRILFFISFFFFFFLLSSFFFFLSTCQYLRHATFDIDQTWRKWPVPWPLLAHKHWWGQRSRWGHWGQKGHFTKIAISPTDYMVWSCDSCILIS